MKNKVLAYFKDLPKSKEEQFNTAFQLYRKCPGKSIAQESFYNRSGYSPSNLENIHYDLKQLVNLKDSEIRNAKKKVVKVAKIELTPEVLETTDLPTIVNFLHQEGIATPKIPEFQKGNKGSAEMRVFCKKYNLNAASNKRADLLEVINAFYKKAILQLANDYFKVKEQHSDLSNKIKEGLKNENATNAEEVFTKAPDNVKQGIKLRDEFPFLNEKDCPEEFYILIGHKFNHYDAYVKAHESLLVITEEDQERKLTQEEINAIAKQAVLNFEVNQAIYDELQHYKNTGKILGNHPIFIERKLKDKVEALNVEAATKRISNLENYIRRDGAKLEKAEKSKNKKDIEKYQKKVNDWEVELRMIKTKFNFANEK